MVWWLPVLGMHFKRWKWLPEEKNDPKNQVPRSSLKRSCGAVKRGWCSIVKSAVGLSSDWIWAVVVYQSAPWRSDRGCRVFWGAWQERATVRSNPRWDLGLNTVWILPPFSSICELISQFSLFSMPGMYENRGWTSDLNIFVTSKRYRTNREPSTVPGTSTVLVYVYQTA